MTTTGQALRNLSLRAEISVNGFCVSDFGTLSARNLVTDGTGRASAIYTAPPSRRRCRSAAEHAGPDSRSSRELAPTSATPRRALPASGWCRWASSSPPSNGLDAESSSRANPDGADRPPDGVLRRVGQHRLRTRRSWPCTGGPSGTATRATGIATSHSFDDPGDLRRHPHVMTDSIRPGELGLAESMTGGPGARSRPPRSSPAELADHRPDGQLQRRRRQLPAPGRVIRSWDWDFRATARPAGGAAGVSTPTGTSGATPSS